MYLYSPNLRRRDSKWFSERNSGSETHQILEILLCCSVLQRVAACSSAVRCVTVSCIVWQCVAVCGIALQCKQLQRLLSNKSSEKRPTVIHSSVKRPITIHCTFQISLLRFIPRAVQTTSTSPFK